MEDIKKNKAKGISTSVIFMIEHCASISDSWILDIGCGTHIFSDVQGLKRIRKIRHSELDLIIGIKSKVVVTKNRDYKFVLSSSFLVSLLYCYYSPYIEINIISFHSLY